MPRPKNDQYAIRQLSMRVCLFIEGHRTLKQQEYPRQWLAKKLQNNFGMSAASAYRHVSDYIAAKGWTL